MSGSYATDPNNRSSAEIEREVEATRAGLTETLDELRDRASPGQLFEQALDYARTSGGAEFARNLGQSVRDNPLPLLLIGAGIGWLMMSGGNRQVSDARISGERLPGRPISSGSHYRVYGETESSTSSMADHASAAAGRVGEAVGGLRDSVAGAASQVADKAGSTYRDAADAAISATDRVGDAASAAAQRVADAGQDVRAQAAYLGDSARQGVGWLMREQPLVLGAIGVALGAAVGALLPGTEAEDRLMGETRDALADRAQATAQEGYERVKETATEHLEHAKTAVGDATGGAGAMGGSAGRIGDALGEAAQQVRHVAREAARDLAGEARNAMSTGEKSGPDATPGMSQQRRDDLPPSGPSPQRSGPT